MKIRRAIVSVYEKMGVVDFAKGLVEMGVEVLSTGGTAELLKKSGVPVTCIREFTGTPEMFGQRLKTLHHKIHGGILYKRGDEDHEKQKDECDIKGIDLVVVNLFPFESTIAKPGVSLEDALSNIDLGGPAMIRSGARNWRDVTVVVDHGDYARVLDEMHEHNGGTSDDLRFELARKVFAHTSRYEGMIASWLEEHDREVHKIEGFPQVLRLELTKSMDLRYGENPHQRASLYIRRHAHEASAAASRQLSGKELSFNNLLDASAALELVKELDEPAAAIVKHTNPCGVAMKSTLAEAYHAAYEGDPLSAYDSGVGVNRRVDVDTAKEMTQAGRLVEVIIAPAFDDEAVEIIRATPNWGQEVRLLASGDLGRRDKDEYDIRAISGGLLRQDRDLTLDGLKDYHVVSKRAPTDEEMIELRFAWIVCKHVKSNAIVISKDNTVVGVGGGQMSQVDAAIIAARKSATNARGGCAASDAFFWTPDALQTLAGCGVTALIQPSGAKQDESILAAADRLNVAMVHTSVRHYSH